MRILFAGTPSIAIPSLEAFIEAGHEVAAVLTQPDARGRRGSRTHPSPVRAFAEERGLPVLTPARASAPESVQAVRELGVDAAAVVAYGQILSRALIDAVPSGWVNLHFSLLPAWRGAAPVQRAIMAGDDVTGATAFVIEPALDEGPVLGALTEAIRPTDTTGDLLGRLADRGAPLLVDAVAGLAGGTLTPVPQAGEGVSYAAKITREDAYARWDRPAHLVDRQVRACTPDPGAWTTLPDGSVAKLGPVTPRPDLAAGVPGTVVADGDRVVVRTGTHPVELSWIAPAGRKAMEAGAWWRGARLGGGAAFPAGALLGEA